MLGLLRLSLPAHYGSLVRIMNSKQICLDHFLLFCLSVSLLLEELILFAISAAGVKSCRGHKKWPTNIIHSAVYISLFGPLRSMQYSEKSENIIGLDLYFKHFFYGFAIWSAFGFILVFGTTAFLKIEITICFFWLSLPVHIGSLTRTTYSKQICLVHFLSFECIHCS